MQTREILSIVALAALGLCLLCGLAKMAMKNPKAKQACNKACSLLVFVGLTLIGVSQLLGETKNTSPQVPAHLMPVPLGGDCSPSEGKDCAPGLQCETKGIGSSGKCMLPIPDPSGHHHHTSGPKPPPAPGTLGGACQAAIGLPQCKSGLKCSSGKCMLPIPDPSGHHHTNGPHHTKHYSQ